MKVFKAPYNSLWMIVVATFALIVNYETTWAAVLLMMSIAGNLGLLYWERHQI